MDNRILFYSISFLAIGLIAGVLASSLYYQDQSNSLESERDSALAIVEELEASMRPPSLPEGAVQLSPLVPGMGEHWAVPSQLPTGPIYLVFEGRVIGVEFMVKPEWMSESKSGPPGTLELAGDTSIKAMVDHITIDYLDHGHEGAEEPHYDVHLYFITEEERQSIK